LFERFYSTTRVTQQILQKGLISVPFKTILESLMDSVPGATGAILADWEGEAVEQSCLYEIYDLKVIGAHKGILLNLLRDAHQKLAAGELKHTVITTEKQHYLTGPVGADYFLVMTLDRTAIVGLAIRHFQTAIDRMYKEIY
jgi:predicted regulator of Ras-like GTPase activity (Roadblock/LC7/MglB family)